MIKIKLSDHFENVSDLENEKSDTTTSEENIEELSDLETVEEAEKRQKGQGLKVMTPSQLITRLPILLAKLKAGNNSQKLKDEIKQILYSLYRSKNVTKTLYNHLINSI